MRLGVYTDYAYHRLGDDIYAERAFALFLAGLRQEFDRLLLVGRLDPDGGRARYPVGSEVELLALPFYRDLARARQVIPTFGRSLRAFWRALPELDGVWLLGPHPLAMAFAILALIRRKRVVLGVRQDMPAYVRNRHPRRPLIQGTAWILESAFRLLALLVPVAVVGPDLARNYRRSRTVLDLTVSLVGERDVLPVDVASRRSFDGEVRLLSVGRLENEKNPLLLAEVLALLNDSGDRRWRLVVCGEGGLEGALEERLTELGQRGQADLLGYVPFGEQLWEVYRSCHILMHTSWTEGLPGTLVEAFAAGLPAVAADVGGIAEAVGEAALVVPAGDAAAAAAAARRIRDDEELRVRMLRAGFSYASAHTIEAQIRSLAGFLRNG